MTPLASLTVVLAQAADPSVSALPKPPTGAPGGTTSASVSLLLLLVLAAWICVRQKGAQWPHIGLGILIGVVGATTVIGTLSWSVIGVFMTLLEKVGELFQGGVLH